MKPTTLTWPAVAPFASSCLMDTLVSNGALTTSGISYNYNVVDDPGPELDVEDEAAPEPAPRRFKKIRT